LNGLGLERPIVLLSDKMLMFASARRACELVTDSAQPERQVEGFDVLPKKKIFSKDCCLLRADFAR
jgi:hypothetical protein